MNHRVTPGSPYRRRVKFFGQVDRFLDGPFDLEEGHRQCRCGHQSACELVERYRGWLTKCCQEGNEHSDHCCYGAFSHDPDLLQGG